MGKFNKPNTRPAVSSAVKTNATSTTVTGEGGPGYLRDAKGEAFLLAVTNTVGDDTFYENARDRDDRYTTLIRRLAVEDPAWTAEMLGWLRTSGNMRSAAIVGAAEYVKGRLDAGEAGTRPGRIHETKDPKTGAFQGDSLSYSAYSNRRVIDSVLQRADEPGELIAYWTSKYGRNIPKPVKRGIADAVSRLYTERSLLKYDTDSKGYRFGDVIDLVHPVAGSHAEAWRAWQGELFKFALDSRHGRNIEMEALSGVLPMVHANHVLRWMVNHGGKPEALLNPDNLRGAGMTWEDALSLAGSKVDKRALWEALIPSMGYMALLRNLRNFDQAGVSDEIAEQVTARLADPEQVAKSRQFPFRFLSAYRAVPSLRWAWPLERALNHSLANVPTLPGRSLVLVDRSPSMWQQRFSGRSTMPWADAAAVFGAALALRAANADLVEFGIDNNPVHFRPGESVLKVIERFRQLNGTDIPSAVAAHLAGHDRVIIVTDEQTRPGWLPSNGEYYGGGPARRIDDLIPQGTPLYMWNFGGYQAGAAPSGGGNRHTLGGLSDAAFRLIPLLEAGRNAGWPWEEQASA